MEVKKLECADQVQKRVGSRLRNLRKSKKGLSWQGRLTNDTIDCLKIHNVIAIRQNVGNFLGMKKTIHAVLSHVSSSKKNSWHDHCPSGESSWCKFNQDQTCGTSTYIPSVGLPLNIVCKLKPIYNNLSSDTLLEKCLHGKTQNQNESFNGMIWENLRKTKYVSSFQLQFGVYDAVANFNIGRKASVMIYEKLNMVPGRFTLKGCTILN